MATVRACAILVLLATNASCGKNEQSEAPAPSTPLVTPEAISSHEALSASVESGGYSSQYDAHFDEQRLTRIEERRRSETGESTGTYDFEGARLIAYSGDELSGAGAMALRFDMNGALLEGIVADRRAVDAEVSAVRDRAQLLRSHALAQRASRAHEQETR